MPPCPPPRHAARNLSAVWVALCISAAAATAHQRAPAETGGIEVSGFLRRAAALKAAAEASVQPAATLGGETSKRPSAASASGQGDSGLGGRRCMEMPGVRLDNGLGAIGDGAEVGTPEKCREHCRGLPTCGQAVFAAAGGNGTCFAFERPTFALWHWQGDGTYQADYSSVVCGPPAALSRYVSQARHARRALSETRWLVAVSKADELLRNLTLQDKVALLRGVDGESNGFAGVINPRTAGGNEHALRLTMNDGPQGFNAYADPTRGGSTTQFPSLLALAASFSTATVRRYASAVAEEFVQKGANVLLGPDVEVTRVASTGRSWESLTGEEPFLGAQLVGPFIEEVQSRGVIATVKHYVDNNQEVRRKSMNSEVGDRAQHEVYLAPFRAAIEAGAGAVMCSYNKVYGKYACENDKLLRTQLREDLNFRGFVVSDWGAVHDALASAEGGLDVEMPGSGALYAQLPELVASGQLDQGVVDGMAGHVLSTMYMMGHFDGTVEDPPSGVLPDDVTSQAHRDVARQTIVDGAVLLKNTGGALPLATTGKKIAMIGKWCTNTEYYAPKSVTAEVASPFMGQGSGYVPTTRTVSILQGMQDLVHDAASITWSADASAGQGADIAIVCASACNAHEGWDRESFELPEARDLIGALRGQPGVKKVVLLGVVPGGVTSDWRDNVDAAMLLFFPGEQAGVAAAELLTGVASPGGRLPVTMPPDGAKPIDDGTGEGFAQFTRPQYPGVQAPPFPRNDYGQHLTANFSEGVLVGYRWYDAKDIRPHFAFGFGLTYTDFLFEDFAVACANGKLVLTLQVVNAGVRTGDAVPQVYVAFQDLLPVRRQLRGFQKVHVPAGAVVQVAFVLGPEDFSTYCEECGKWTSAMSKGHPLTVSVGTSSADVAWSQTLTCPQQIAA